MYDTCSPPSINNSPLPPPLCPNIAYKFSGLNSLHFLMNWLGEFEKLMIKAFLLWWSCHSHNLFIVPRTCKTCKKKNFFSPFLNSNKATFLQMGQWTCSSLRVELRMQDNILGTQRHGRKNPELQITRTFYSKINIL